MFSRVFQTNYFGVLRTLNIATPLLKKSKNNPKLVLISSLSTRAFFPRAEAYGASKAAIEYTFLANEVQQQQDGISSTIIRPGFIDTPLTKQNKFPMPFLMTPESAASRILMAINKNKRSYDFPKRLSWLIRLAFFIRPLRRKKVMPSMMKPSR